MTETGRIIDEPTYDETSKKYTLKYKDYDYGIEFKFTVDERGNVELIESQAGNPESGGSQTGNSGDIVTGEYYLFGRGEVTIPSPTEAPVKWIVEGTEYSVDSYFTRFYINSAGITITNNDSMDYWRTGEYEVSCVDGEVVVGEYIVKVLGLEQFDFDCRNSRGKEPDNPVTSGASSILVNSQGDMVSFDILYPEVFADYNDWNIYYWSNSSWSYEEVGEDFYRDTSSCLFRYQVLEENFNEGRIELKLRSEICNCDFSIILEACEHTNGWYYEGAYESAICVFCGLECTHDWNDGVCGICGIPCIPHQWNIYGECEKCHLQCEHDWYNGHCDICGMTCEHHNMMDGECMDCHWREENY